MVLFKKTKLTEHFSASALLIFYIFLLLAASGYLAYAKLINPAARFLPTRHWQTFSDTNNGVEFKYPNINDPNHLTGTATESGDYKNSKATSNAPSGHPVSQDGNSYTIQFPDTSNSALYFGSAEDTRPSSDLTLGITLYNDRLTDWEPEILSSSKIAMPYQLKKSPENSRLTVVQKKGNYTYKLNNQGTGSIHLLQCLPDGSCSSVIKRSNSIYPYAIVSVSTADGWRYGGASIDTNSHNFQVMKTVLSTLNLDLKTTNHNYSAVNNESPCYKAIDHQKVFDNVYHAYVTNVDISSRALAVQYYLPTDPAHYNESSHDPISKTYSIPASARIVSGGLCEPRDFSAFHLGESIIIYRESGTNTITTVYIISG